MGAKAARFVRRFACRLRSHFEGAHGEPNASRAHLGQMALTTTRPLLRELGTLPNLLTLVRIPMGLAIWLAPTNPAWLLGLMVGAAVSDFLDGWFARRAGLPGESIGAWLDPVCDKFFILSVLVAVWVTRQPPLWMALVASTREVVLLPLVIARFSVPRLRKGGIPWRAMLLGKATTVMQFALFAAVLAGWRAAWTPLAVACGVLGVGAGLQYLLRAWRAMHS